MTTTGGSSAAGGRITLRYWAAAKAAAGVASDEVPAEHAVPLADLVQDAVRRHGERFAQVVEVCSVLVDDRPAGTEDPGRVLVRPGQSVEFLPPFAGG